MTPRAVAAGLTACVCAAIVAALLIHRYAMPAPSFYFANDQPAYLSLAKQPFVQTPAVYAPASWRVFPPLAARALADATGTDAEHGFLLLTFGCLALMPIAAFFFLTALGLSPQTSLVGAAVVALSPTMLGYAAWDVVRVDPPSLLLLFVASYAVIRRLNILLIASIVALALTKETVFLGVFFALAWAVRFDRRMLPSALASLAAAVVLRVFVLPRVMPSPIAFDNLFALKDLVQEFTPRYAARRLLLASATTWNLMLPLAALWLATSLRDRLAQVLLAAIIVAESQILVASETQRIVAAGYPYVVACAAFALESLGARRRAVGAALVLAQLPWLWENGRIVHLAWLRGVEIGIAIATGAVVLWGARYARTNRRPSTVQPPASTSPMASG